jgi:hypothetical protein
MKYIKLLLGVFCLVVGYFSIRDYLDAPKRRNLAVQVAEYEELDKSGVKTQARLDSSPKKSHVNDYGIYTSSVYRVKYFFTVHGMPYDGVYKTAELPEGETIAIYYSPENPTINAVNPAAVLRELKSPERRFYAGTFLLLMGVLLFYSAFKKTHK